METLQDLARRLQSVRDLHSVVRTMKALAAVNIGQFERTAQSVDEYAKTVRLGLMALLRNPRTPLSVRPGPTGPLGGIVFGSDQGMCGRLNEELARMTCTALEKESQRRITLLAVGERVAGSLEDAGFPPTDIYRVPSGTGGIPALVQTLVVDIQHWTQTHGLQEVRLFHPR